MVLSSSYSIDLSLKTHLRAIDVSSIQQYIYVCLCACVCVCARVCNQQKKPLLLHTNLQIMYNNEDY